MKPLHRTVVCSALIALLMLTALPGVTSAAPERVTVSALDFQNAMRKLWEDHITWTRLAIVAILDDRPEKDAAVQRLLQNQVDIGDAIKPYYGDAAGAQLTSLLHDHITGAAALLVAAKSGDQARIKAAGDAWYANGNDIAAFLNKANPTNWPLATVQDMMKMHLDTTLAEAVAHLKKDYAADIADYDAVHEHILHMADALSSGIIAQFPDRFTAAPPAGQLAFDLTMRKLWEDHITWTRLAILDIFENDAETNATVQRLLQNQVDIGNAVKPYYGDAAGNQLTALLQDHITGAAALLMAAKSGDQAKIKEASDAWYANGNAIAALLNKANPTAWPLATLQDMMKMHLDTTVAEATANLKGDYSADVAGYDAVHEHILHMADALSEGIIAEFPQQFGAPQVVGMPRTGQPGPDAWFWLIALVAGNVLLVAGRYLRRKPAA
jgi:gas vesicle protein